MIKFERSEKNRYNFLLRQSARPKIIFVIKDCGFSLLATADNLKPTSDMSLGYVRKHVRLEK